MVFNVCGTSIINDLILLSLSDTIKCFPSNVNTLDLITLSRETSLGKSDEILAKWRMFFPDKNFPWQTIFPDD